MVETLAEMRSIAPTPSGDLLVVSRWKNAKLFDLLQEYGSRIGVDRAGKLLAEEVGISAWYFYGYINLTRSPWKRDGELKPTAKKLCDFFEIAADDLFPLELYRLAERLPRTVERRFDSESVIVALGAAKEILYLPPHLDESQRQVPSSEVLDGVLHTLTPREERVIRLRFGLDGAEASLEETAQAFQVTRERIRQIEAKALRKLRHPSRARHLREEPRVEVEPPTIPVAEPTIELKPWNEMWRDDISREYLRRYRRGIKRVQPFRDVYTEKLRLWLGCDHVVEKYVARYQYNVGCTPSYVLCRECYEVDLDKTKHSQGR